MCNFFLLLRQKLHLLPKMFPYRKKLVFTCFVSLYLLNFHVYNDAYSMYIILTFFYHFSYIPNKFHYLFIEKRIFESLGHMSWRDNISTRGREGQSNEILCIVKFVGSKNFMEKILYKYKQKNSAFHFILLSTLFRN